jgi:hypothetical protein
MVTGALSGALWLPYLPAAEATTTTVTPTTAGPPPGMSGPIVVNNGPGDQIIGGISGNLVSYTDQSSGYQIRYHDLAANSDAAIPNNGASDLRSDVLGSVVVYTRVTGGTQAIYSFDTATPAQAPQELDPQPNSVRSNSSIGAATVVWEDYVLNPNGPEIVAYDRASGSTTRLTNDAFSDVNPAVSPSGTVVAWTKCTSAAAGCAIYQASLAGGTWSAPQRLTDPTIGDCELPHTNGAVVAYDCTRGGQQSIFWQPVGGGSENQLALSGNSQNANVSGTLISFERRDPTAAAPNWDLYAYSMANNTVYQITNTPNDEILSDISVGADGVARMVWSVREATNGFNAYAVNFPQPSANRPPDCSKVTLDKALLWPANDSFVPVTASGATDPEGGAVTTRVDGMTQDEPTAGLYKGDTGPDGQLSSPPSATALVRAERSDVGNGRVYHLHITATDSAGLTCTADRTVGVPHDQGSGATPIDSAPPSYNSLQ